MGIRQPTAETKDNGPGWIMRNVFPVFIRDHNHPAKIAAIEEAKRVLQPAAAEWGLGFLEASQLAPSHPFVQILQNTRPDLHIPHVGDLWSKNGTRKK